MPVPLIIYFDVRGRAEAIRLAFEELGEAYDEDRVTPERWATMKADTPFGGLPILEDRGLRLPQALPIYQHLARTRGLYGADEAERALVDVTMAAVDEAIGVLWGVLGTAETGHSSGPLDETLARLERWLLRDTSGPTGWVGERLTMADIFAFRFLDEVDAFLPDCLARRQSLAGFHADFAARPRIAAYLSSGRRPPGCGAIRGQLIEDPRPSGRPANARGGHHAA